jgi:hypothetical protein
MQFDHVGMPATRVWITDAHQHPFRVEWLLFEPDSPVTGPLHDRPHVGFRVGNVGQITKLSQGLKVLLEPFDAGFAVAGFYQTPDGASIELVWYRNEPKA